MTQKAEIPTIEKSTVECYKIRGLSGSGWADITIDANGEKGRIQIASDYGSYQHFWSSCGCGFKQFLTQLNLDYVADKFRADDYFDAKKTVRNYKETLIEARKFGDMEKSRARIIFDEIKSLEEFYSKDSFIAQINYECPHILAYYDNTPELCESVHPRFIRFWNDCWLPLMEVFKQEAKR